MNGQTVRTKSLKGGARTHRAAAVVAALLFLVSTTAGAQGLTKAGTGTLRLNATVGLVPGQTLRVNVPSPDSAGDINGDGRADIITAAVTLFDATGGMIYQTPEAVIPAGGFHSFDIKRADLTAAGEPRTGRLEVRVELVLRAARARGEAEGAQGNLNKVGQGVLQLIDNDSGKTTVALLLPAVQKVREAAARN
jgi:hypothetical protein